MHLLKCKPQCEEAFSHIAWKSSRETFATKRNDLGSVSSEGRNRTELSDGGPRRCCSAAALARK